MRSVILYFLHGIAQLWFALTLIACLLHIVFLFSNKNGYFIKNKNSSWGVTNMYYNGYPAAASLTVQMPADTIIEYKNGLSSGVISLNKGSSYRYEKTDSILNDTAIKKQFYFSKWVTEPGFSSSDAQYSSYEAADEFALFDTIIKHKSNNLKAEIDKSYAYEVPVKLKSNNAFKNIALAFFSLLNIFSLLIISFNTAKLFGYIRRKNNFVEPLYKKTMIIGIVLIVTQFLQLILSFLFARWYGAITLEKVSSIDKIGGQEFHVQFNPAITFSMITFLFGLCLIVLASMFKYGYKLEKEQSLTI